MTKKIVSFLLVAVIFAYLFFNIWQDRNAVLNVAWNVSILNISLLLLSLILVFLSSTVSWHLLTLSMGIKIPFKVNFKIWMVSNFARLLPGTVWQYLSRVYLLKKAGVQQKRGITAVILETILNLTAASILFFVTLPFWKLPEEFRIFQGWFWGFLIPPIFLILLTNKQCLNLILMIMNKVAGKNLEIKNMSIIPLSLLIPLIIAFFIRFISTGFVLFLVLLMSQSLGANVWIALIGIFSFSWLLGYITLFSPGGLGVVEISLAALLSVYMPFSLAAAIAVVFRVVLLFGEGIFLIISLNLNSSKSGTSEL